MSVFFYFQEMIELPGWTNIAKDFAEENSTTEKKIKKQKTKISCIYLKSTTILW